LSSGPRRRRNSGRNENEIHRQEARMGLHKNSTLGKCRCASCMEQHRAAQRKRRVTPTAKAVPDWLQRRAARLCKCGSGKYRTPYQPDCSSCRPSRKGQTVRPFREAVLEKLGLGKNLKRCRCGLILPCWSCVPTVAEMAESQSRAE
jgi:hypothetical protein